MSDYEFPSQSDCDKLSHESLSNKNIPRDAINQSWWSVIGSYHYPMLRPLLSHQLAISIPKKNHMIQCVPSFSDNYPINPIPLLILNTPVRMLVGGLNPSEKYESQLGWLETQYLWENKIHGNQSPPTSMVFGRKCPHSIGIMVDGGVDYERGDEWDPWTWRFPEYVDWLSHFTIPLLSIIISMS